MTERYIKTDREVEHNPRLNVNLLGTSIPSPLILGSGTLVEKAEEIEPFLEAGAGAVVPRSTRREMVRKVHPSPHLYQSGRRGNEMMLNAEWTGADINYWEPYLPEIAKSKRVIMSVSGRDVEGCIDVCKILDPHHFLMIEVNISCAHSNSVHGFITRNGDHITQVVKGIKDAGVETPIGIKLGHSDYIVELSQIAKEAGANAIVALNSYGPLLDFNVKAGGVAEPVLGIEGAMGGMSGAPLFNIALTDVAQIRSQVGIPVIGCGGIRTPEHVVKMIMAGASAVQVYTAAHIKGINAASVFTNLNTQMITYLNELGVENIAELQDRALPLLQQKTNLQPLVPEVHIGLCTGCDICLPVCLPDAIDIKSFDNKAGHIVEINDRCIGCGHCVVVCPTDALEIKNIWKSNSEQK